LKLRLYEHASGLTSTLKADYFGVANTENL